MTSLRCQEVRFLLKALAGTLFRFLKREIITLSVFSVMIPESITALTYFIKICFDEPAAKVEVTNRLQWYPSNVLKSFSAKLCVFSNNCIKCSQKTAQFIGRFYKIEEKKMSVLTCYTYTILMDVSIFYLQIVAQQMNMTDGDYVRVCLFSKCLNA
jgi:hypothetical protein